MLPIAHTGSGTVNATDSEQRTAQNVKPGSLAGNPAAPARLLRG